MVQNSKTGRPDSGAPPVPPSGRPDLSIGIVLLEDFALMAFSGICETLRHATNYADRSEQNRCTWTFLTPRNRPVKSSCGVVIEPWGNYQGRFDFDYIAVIGGLISGVDDVPPEFHSYLREAKSKGVTPIGACCGNLVLGDAGLLDHATCSVHWRASSHFKERVPLAVPIEGRPYIFDNGCYTCSSGISSMHLTLALVEKHCGHGRMMKCVDYLSAAPMLMGTTATPDLFDEFSQCGNVLLERGVKQMYQWITGNYSIDDVCREIGSSRRQLERSFKSHTGDTPSKFWRRMRLEYGRRSLAKTGLTITQIAFECGFSDAAHFSKSYKAMFGERPSAYRNSCRAATVLHADTPTLELLKPPE